MRADLLDRVTLVCPACTWRRRAPAALRLEGREGTADEVRTGVLRCVRCAEGYPILQGVAVVVEQGHRRVAQETHEVDDPLRQVGPHLLAHWGDLLDPEVAGPAPGGDLWPRLGDMDAGGGLAVDLGACVGRAVAGLARTASFALGCEASFVTARLARSFLGARRATVRVVDEGAFASLSEADISVMCGGDAEIVVADPERPPVAPGRASVVVAANLLERQSDPEAFVRMAASLPAPGGRLAVASPYTWWEEHAPRERWLGKGEARTRDALVALLADLGHDVESEADLLLVLREHARLEQVVRPHLVVTRRR